MDTFYAWGERVPRHQDRRESATECIPHRPIQAGLMRIGTGIFGSARSGDCGQPFDKTLRVEPPFGHS
jgi:hypothetical protein